MPRSKSLLRPLEAHRHLLPNGARLLVVPMPWVREASLIASLAVGSADEREEINGISHLVEHMVFRGTETWPSTFELNVAADELGGSLNAATGRIDTEYTTPLHPDGLPTLSRLVGEMLGAPLLGGLEKEREIVVEELQGDLDDQGRDLDMDDLSKEARFGDHPMGLRIGGTPRSVRRLGQKEVVAHVRKNHVGNRLTVVAAGDFSPDEAFRALEAGFGGLPKGTPRKTPSLPPMQRGPYATFHVRAESQVTLRLTYTAPDLTGPLAPAVRMIRRLLDDGLASRLARSVVEERGLAYSASAWADVFLGFGLFEVQASCMPEKAAELLDVLLQELQLMAGEDVPEEELARARRRHALAIDFVGDSAGEVAGWYGAFSSLPIEPHAPIDTLAPTASVRPGELRAVAEALFDPSNLQLTVLGPLDRALRDRLSRRVSRLDEGASATRPNPRKSKAPRPPGTRRLHRIG